MNEVHSERGQQRGVELVNIRVLPSDITSEAGGKIDEGFHAEEMSAVHSPERTVDSTSSLQVNQRYLYTARLLLLFFLYRKYIAETFS